MALPKATVTITKPDHEYVGNRWTLSFEYLDNAGAAVDPNAIAITIRHVETDVEALYDAKTDPAVTKNGTGDYEMTEYQPQWAGTYMVSTFTFDGSDQKYSSDEASFQVYDLTPRVAPVG